MSKYTTELRYICESSLGMDKNGGYNAVKDIIANSRPNIFNFDYPIFDEAYRNVLETKIIKHYYTREIGLESVGLWKLKLDTKMNEIMPYYNQLYKSELLEFNPLYNFNITRDHNVKANGNRTTGDTTTTSTTAQTTSNTNETRANTDLYSDTPQGDLDGITSKTYLTNARKVDDTANISGTQNSSSNGNTYQSGSDVYANTEDYLEHVSGYQGANASELLKKFRETFLNIDMQVIEELEELFFQLW